MCIAVNLSPSVSTSTLDDRRYPTSNHKTPMSRGESKVRLRSVKDRSMRGGTAKAICALSSFVYLSDAANRDRLRFRRATAPDDLCNLRWTLTL